jgi:SAM-dependent methyltransferase/aryl carrier-like protein
METMVAKGFRAYVEAGPGTTLAGLGRQTITGTDTLWASSLRHGRGEWPQMLESLGELWARGAEVAWAAFDEPYQRRRVSLPTYPFERQRFWIHAQSPAADSGESGNWVEICEAAAHQASRGRLDLNLAEYPKRWALLDTLVTAFIITAWRQQGLYRTAGEGHTAASLIQKSGIRAGYHKMIQRWLEQFAGEGLLARVGTQFVALQPLPVRQLEPLISAVMESFNSDRVIADWVIDCGGRLADLLTGKETPLATLFPGGSFARAEDLYERAAYSAYCASIERGALEVFLRGRRDGCELLEIGAGTGGTAAALIPALPTNAIYHFTDVSDAFLRHAERKFASWPCVRYGLLDIEKQPAEQGYTPGAFDVVIATNVLHATRDLRHSLANLRSLLAPGGMLLLCETTGNMSWLDITAGLIEGWQLSEDNVREAGPLLSASGWHGLLRESGFASVASFPETGSPAEILGQHAFLARVTTAGQRAKQSDSLRRQAHHAPDEPGKAAPEREEILACPPAGRHELLVGLLRRHIAALLRFDSSERISRKQRLIDMGLDSLMAVEFRNRLATALQLERLPSATLIFDFPTVEALADHLETEVLGLAQEFASPTGPIDALAARADELEQLDDEEVAALLVRRLQEL